MQSAISKKATQMFRGWNATALSDTLIVNFLATLSFQSFRCGYPYATCIRLEKCFSRGVLCAGRRQSMSGMGSAFLSIASTTD